MCILQQPLFIAQIGDDVTRVFHEQDPGVFKSANDADIFEVVQLDEVLNGIGLVDDLFVGCGAGRQRQAHH
jgi:hypothetical protein